MAPGREPESNDPMQLKATYPSDAHEAAAEAIVAFWTANDVVEAVLLVNSCARGKATADSCLDMNVLVRQFLQALFISPRTYPIAYNK